MNIDEATKILSHLSSGSHETYINKHKIVAIRLGIAALKRIMLVREMHTSYWSPDLPGETEEQ